MRGLAAKKGASSARKKLQDEVAANNPLFAHATSSQIDQASASFHKGIEGLGNTFMTYAQTQMEETVTTAQKLLSCRSIEEMADLQAQFMQQSFDRLVNEASKIAQTTANLAKETAVPLNDEMERLVQNMNRVV